MSGEQLVHVGTVTGRHAAGGLDWIDYFDDELQQLAAVPDRDEYHELQPGDRVELLLGVPRHGSCTLRRPS
jgi:hypothetical protein